MKNKYENKKICAKCGGYCCKKSGCDYFVEDFDSLKLDVIEESLATGRVSIVAVLNFRHIPNGNIVVEPLLYLRSRNIDRGEIDLFSMKTTCASLQEDGCHYSKDERPSGGVHLLPSRRGHKYCHPDIDLIEEVKKWLPYQNVLEQVIFRHTGMSASEKLREDVENLFYDLLCNNTEGVANEELVDICSSLSLLTEAYVVELSNAFERYKKDKAAGIVK